MTAVRDVAHVNVDVSVADIAHPGDDYRKAAYLVWLACVTEARKGGQRYDEGWLSKAPMTSVVTMLWPTLNDTTARNVAGTITKLLKDSGNALLMERSYGPNSASTWYIRDEFRSLDHVKIAPRKRRRSAPVKSAEVEPEPIKLEIETAAENVARKIVMDAPESEIEPVTPAEAEPSAALVMADLFDTIDRLKAQVADRDAKIDLIRRHLAYILDQL